MALRIPSLAPRDDRARSWVWCQHWLDVLFLHWRVPFAALRPHVSAPLEIDTYDGQAWVSLVLFRMHVRPRWLPFLPGFSNLVELNLRTYVRHRGKPGIWFLSVHADNAWAIRVAKWLTPLPYVRAQLAYRPEGRDGPFRASLASPGEALSLTFTPTPGAREAAEASADAWLLERYRLYIRGRRDKLLQGDVLHPRWRFQDAAVEVAANSLGKSVGLDLTRAPDKAHFSGGVRALFLPFEGLEREAAADRVAFALGDSVR